MTQIACSRAHDLDPAEARRRVDRIATQLADRFGAKGHWEGAILKIDHASVRGTVTLGDGTVRVDATLAFPLSLMRGKATEEVQRILEQELQP